MDVLHDALSAPSRSPVSPMYGTLMRATVLPEHRDRLVAAIEAGERVPVPGFLGSRLLIPDGRADEVWLAVTFEDRSSYERNAASPEQHDRYLAMRQWMAADPAWIDGDWTLLMPLMPPAPNETR